MRGIRFYARFSLPVYALASAVFVLFSVSKCIAFPEASQVIPLREGLKIVSDESRVVKIAKLQESMAKSGSYGFAPPCSQKKITSKE